MSSKRSLLESLEPRRMLTIVLTGTPGADEIDMQVIGNTTNIFINGSLVNSTTSETNFVLNGSDGNDHFALSGIAANTHVAINGGNGNDLVEATDRTFASIANGATLDVAGGADNDQIVVDDTANNIPATYYIDNTGFGNFSGNKHVITVENDVETQNFNFSNVANYLYVGSTETGMTVNFNGGNDVVNFGGGDSIIPANLAAATFNGGTGADTVFLDDNAQQFYSSGPGATYTITPTGAINQTLLGFEQLDLNAAATANSPFVGLNYIIYTGNPGLSTLNLNGEYDSFAVSLNDVTLGTSGSPVDFDNVNLAINFNIPLTGFHVNDQDANNSNNAWILYTTTGTSGAQLITKGSVTLSLPTRVQGNPSAPDSMSINGGSTNDVFEVAGEYANYLQLSGGGGNDTCLFVNYGPDNHAGDLSAIIGTRLFYFYGDAGADTLIADDSAASSGSGHNDYDVSAYPDAISAIGKNQVNLVHFGDDTTENVNFIADNGNNQIAFVEDPANLYNLSLNGGAGNDTFTNGQGFYQSDTGRVTIVGGSGTDNLLIEDGNNPDSQTYGFTGSAFWWYQNTPNHSVVYDSTLESVRLDASNNEGFIYMQSKPAAFPVSIFGGTGDDIFYVGGDDLDSNGLANLHIDGGAGNDALEFDDRNDAYSTSESETYQLNGDELDKGTFSQAYSNFEWLGLYASTNGTNTQAFGSTININTTDVPTTIYGAITRNARINVADATLGDLVSIAAPVTLVMGNAGGATIHDQNSSGDKSYTFSATQFTASSGQVVNFSGGSILFDANGGNNVISINGAGSSTPIIVHGNSGNDTISMGGGNLAQNLAVIPTIDGGADTDVLVFNDSTDPTARSGNLTATALSYDRSYGFQTNMETLKLQTGAGGSSFIVDALPLPTNLAGGSGDDSFAISRGNIDGTLLFNLTATAGGGTDSLLLDDHTDTGNDNYTFSTSSVFTKNTSSKTVTATGFEWYTLSCNPANNVVNANGDTPVTVLGNGGVDTLNAQASNTGIQHFNPNVTFDGGAGLDIVDVNTSVSQGQSAVVKFTSTQDLSAISIGTGGDAIAVQGAGLVLITKSITILGTNSAFLDLNDNGAIVDYTGASQLSSATTSIKTARGNGTWNGTSGITSSSAKNNSQHNTMLGAMEATSYKALSALNTTFDGAAIDNTAVLVKYTYYGDANFNGKVDGSDYARIDSTFNAEHSAGNIAGWVNGDFDFNGKIDGGDYSLIDAAFNSQSGTISKPSSGPPARGRIGEGILID